MHRIDGPGATVDNKFTEGNPATAVPATDVTDDWLNDVQEELLSILAAAGIAPVKGTQNQILLALRAAGVFTTPPQFDSSTKAATMEAVQRAIGNSRGFIGITTNTTLTAAHCGLDIFASTSGAAITLTLPAASALAAGAKFRVMNTGLNDVILTRAGGDTIVLGTTSNTVTAVTLKSGDWIEVVSLGSGTLWYHTGGTGQLGYSGAFGALHSGNGWQRLPSGTILQWCETTQAMAVANTNYTWSATLPVSFPTACRQAFGVFGNNNPAAGFLNITTETLGLSSIQGVCSASSANTRTIRVYAIGN